MLDKYYTEIEDLNEKEDIPEIEHVGNALDYYENYSSTYFRQSRS